MLPTTVLLSLVAAVSAASIPAPAAELAARATDIPVWYTLPATPALPSPISTTTVDVNGIKMWVQEYNKAAGGTPIVMDHGGLGYSAYFGDVISRLIAAGKYVIALDRRGHGRSTFNAADTFTYAQMADDIYVLLNTMKISKYHVVGWSDGGITTLQAMMNSTTAAPIQKAFVYGASALPEQTNATFGDTTIYAGFVTRCGKEYATLQPTADFASFGSKVATMEETLPQFTSADLAKIDGSKLMIAGGQYEEAVNLDVPEILHKAIPKSSVQILTNVSHFAPMQDPDQFTNAVTAWLK